MKIIKFRAWDKIQNKMRSDILSLNVNDAFGKIICFSEGDYLKQDDAEIMQYTGLKDKNGTEIYEGDIVRFDNLSYDPSNGDNLFEFAPVSFKKTYFCVGNDLLEDSEEYEVIGNMYENEDLLKCQ